MRDFAVAIRIDDEVDYVRLVVDILRRNWTGDFHVAVCTSSASCATELGTCDIDDLALTEDIHLGTDPRADGQGQFVAALRDVEGVQTVCALAARSGAPYTIHLRPGSYPLSSERLRALGEEMRRKGKVLAARGHGFGLYAHDTPVGRLDDSLFVFDNEFARETGLWQFELADFLPHKVRVQGFLALWALARVGVRRFWRYSGDVGGHPMMFDPDRLFLKVDERRLPGDLAARVKASYFIEHGVTRGKAMERFLAQWGDDLGSVRKELGELPRLSDEDVSRSGPPGWLLRWVYRYRYGDMVWPGRLDDVYRALMTETAEVPAGLRGVSFDMQRLG